MIRTFTQYIREGKNFSFVKFGDSELLCMDGRDGKNGDHHPFSPDLCEALNVAYNELAKQPESYFAEWTGTWAELYPHRDVSFVEYETLLPTVYHPDLKGLAEFYRAIKESKRKKIYVAPKRSRAVMDLLGIDVVIHVPQLNCWSDYEDIKWVLKDDIEKDCIILFSCTMLANVLIGDFYKGDITCLDVGSAFDPYCGIRNRERQMTTLEAQRFFTTGAAPVSSDLSKVYFVHIRNPRTGHYYESYNDYFRLVHLAGFQECDLEEVNPHSNNTYIITLNYDGFDQKPIPDKYFPKDRTCRMIHHQLERFDLIDERFDEIWLYDLSMPELQHPKAKYVVLGGDKNFMDDIGRIGKAFDFYHMCYPVGRRGPMIAELAALGFSISAVPLEWTEKNFFMQATRVGLALHQHEHSLDLIEPLRLTVFSCMKLPILAEKSANFSPYYVYSYEEFLKNPEGFHEMTNWQDNWEMMTQAFTFKNEIIKALKR